MRFGTKESKIIPKLNTWNPQPPGSNSLSLSESIQYTEMPINVPRLTNTQQKHVLTLDRWKYQTIYPAVCLTHFLDAYNVKGTFFLGSGATGLEAKNLNR